MMNNSNIHNLIQNQLDSLNNKTALITGGTSGIGFGIGKKLAQWGVKLCIIGNESMAKITSKIDELSSFADVFYLQYDLSRLAEDGALTEFFTIHKPDILINNAGIQTISGVADFQLDHFQKVIDVNGDHLVECFLTKDHILLQHQTNDQRYSFSSPRFCYQSFIYKTTKVMPGVVLLILHPPMVWWLQQINPPMWQPSTGLWGLLKL